MTTPHQPRIMTLPNRAAAAARPARRKADDGRDEHLAAPMPGSVSTVAVRKGQAVRAGDVVMTIEAMKMETLLHAPFDGTIAELLVSPGQAIDAKDLLAVFEPSPPSY